MLRLHRNVQVCCAHEIANLPNLLLLIVGLVQLAIELIGPRLEALDRSETLWVQGETNIF